MSVEGIKRGESDPMLQFFRTDGMTEAQQAVAGPFGALATKIVENLPRNPERTVTLRKLLEAKDAALRSVVFEG